MHLWRRTLVCVFVFLSLVHTLICCCVLGSTLVEPNKAQDSSYMQLNEFHTAISYADYVVDMTSLDNLGNQTYDSWLNLGGFIDGMDVFDEPFVTNKNVFRFDGLVNGNGYSGTGGCYWMMNHF